MKKRKRLDVLLVERKKAATLEQAQSLIDEGLILVNGIISKKAASLCSLESTITFKKEKRKYVSRGGDKLEAALQGFDIDPTGRVCVDIGCSTGGFTDCLLHYGAKRVYCVDVGYGVLDWSLRQDPRTVVLERTNARFLTGNEIPESVEIAVIDASFISLELLLSPLVALFEKEVRILALVKPQFQLPRDKVAQGGIVTSSALHTEALTMVEKFGSDIGLNCQGVIASPIKGTKGNQEFLMYLTGLNAHQ